MTPIPADNALSALAEMHAAWPTNDDVRAWKNEFETIRTYITSTAGQFICPGAPHCWSGKSIGEAVRTYKLLFCDEHPPQPDKCEGLAEWIRLLLPLAKGYVHANPGIRSTENIIEDAENAIKAYKETT